jgi:hypothetical protein
MSTKGGVLTTPLKIREINEINKNKSTPLKANSSTLKDNHVLELLMLLRPFCHQVVFSHELDFSKKKRQAYIKKTH